MSYKFFDYFVTLLNKAQIRGIFDIKPMPWKVMSVQGSVISFRNGLLVFSCLLSINVVSISGCSSDKSHEESELTQQQKGNTTSKSTHKEIGEASWYGPGFQGKETASGEAFDQKDLTAAHPSLPMGATAKVTNLENGKKVDVRINDRGPYSGGRVIDLSNAAAKKLDMKEDGSTQVKIETKSTPKK
jgi:rare lipoprotein A (peptidoglycan hydrolase)